MGTGTRPRPASSAQDPRQPPDLACHWKRALHHSTPGSVAAECTRFARYPPWRYRHLGRTPLTRFHYHASSSHLVIITPEFPNAALKPNPDRTLDPDDFWALQTAPPM